MSPASGSNAQGRAPVERRTRGGGAGGFTLIEVVIALAIGVMIVVAVTGTVRSLSRSARNIEESSAGDEAWLRFSGIFRRDVRGWIPGAERAPENRNAQPSEAQPFFVCQTTADALAGSAEAGNRPAPRLTSVRYSVKRSGEAFVISRSEEDGANVFEVPMLHTKTEPKVEFFDGQRWSTGHQGAQLPVAVRLKVDGRELIVGSSGAEGPVAP